MTPADPPAGIPVSVGWDSTGVSVKGVSAETDCAGSPGRMAADETIGVVDGETGASARIELVGGAAVEIKSELVGVGVA